MTKLYVSDTTQVIAVDGVSARFTAGVHRPLRPSLVHACLAAGVRPVGGEEPDTSAPEPDSPPVELDGDRQAAIVEAIEIIMADGAKNSFTTSGAIRMNVLEKQLGFDVSAEERDAAMESIKATVNGTVED